VLVEGINAFVKQV